MCILWGITDFDLNMKHLIALFILLSMNAYSQQTQQQDYGNETIYKINLLSPGVEIEKDLFKEFSGVLNVGVFPYVFYSDSFLFEERSGILFPLFIDAQFRYYTNFQRRLEKGKSIKNNSGNFLSLKLSHYFEAENDEATFDSGSILGVVYGIQRTYWSHLHLTLEMGAGIYKGTDEPTVTGAPVLSFQIGYSF